MLKSAANTPAAQSNASAIATTKTRFMPFSLTLRYAASQAAEPIMGSVNCDVKQKQQKDAPGVRWAGVRYKLGRKPAAANTMSSVNPATAVSAARRNFRSQPFHRF